MSSYSTRRGHARDKFSTEVFPWGLKVKTVVGRTSTHAQEPPRDNRRRNHTWTVAIEMLGSPKPAITIKAYPMTATASDHPDPTAPNNAKCPVNVIGCDDIFVVRFCEILTRITLSKKSDPA
jgi:hypothetical protein